MTNANWDEVGKALTRRLHADYLETHIKEPFKGSVTTLLAEDGMFLSESMDVVLLFVFTYIDLLGYLYKGTNSSNNAVEFMRKYLGKVDKRYKEASGLLYDALRHGYTHLATPKRIELKDGKILDFSFLLAGQREDHLKLKKTTEMQRIGGRVDIYGLSLSLSLLYEDLVSAMDIYAEDIRHNQELSDTFWEAFETRRRPQNAKEEELLSKPYIQDSDFAFVKEQIPNL